MAAKKREIEIEISPDGDSVTLHIMGVKGKECLDATELLEKGLGKVIDRKLSTEYREVPDKKVVNVGFGKVK
jgi:hypothetical protein